jgi:ABC-type bacteriocin/lantibiotic exporter with double-glycine peptidase domain
MQAALNTIRNSSAAGKPTLDFYHRLDSTLSTKVSRKVAPMTSFADIEFKNVSFKYRTREDFNISEVSFHAESGATIALVGKSGSGKSTIADLISGVLLPASGSVSIGGLSAREWINSHPRKMIYIPQAVGILNSSLIDNICLGIPKHIQDRDLAIQIINDLDLGSMLEALPDGLDSALGENAVQLSGGQRQRIGLARSLYFKPSLIIMDESTNALDAETEASIRSFASSSTSGVTKIIVAHKLSLLNDVNRILFFENGRILFEGDFAAMSKFSKF